MTELIIIEIIKQTLKQFNLFYKYWFMYWKIENWKVVEFYRELPKVIWNTSLGKNITNEELKEFWILPVIWITKPLEEWQSYWEKTYNILEDIIEEDKEIIDEPLENYKKNKIHILSDRCRADIIKEYDEDDQRNILMQWIEEDIKIMREIIFNRREEFHNQKKIIEEFKTYQEVKDYANNLYPNKEI